MHLLSHIVDTSMAPVLTDQHLYRRVLRRLMYYTTHAYALLKSSAIHILTFQTVKGGIAPSQKNGVCEALLSGRERNSWIRIRSRCSVTAQ